LRSAGAADLLLLASGTGWAPLKALVEQVAAEGGQRRVDVYVGFRSFGECYDGEALDKLAVSYPWLTVHQVAGLDLHRPGEFVSAVDRALADGDWRSRHVYVCGSDDMVARTVATLTRSGYHPGQLHYEGSGQQWYGPAWRSTVPTVRDDSGGAR
jgi:ferredoxin-NADP reductase